VGAAISDDLGSRVGGWLLVPEGCNEGAASDDVEPVRGFLAVVMAEDEGAFEVEDTIADAASNGNTLVAMAAAVQVGIGWLRRGVILEEVTAEVLAAVDVRLLGSLPLRTWPFLLEESSLGLMLAGGPSSHGQMESFAVEAVLKRA